MIEVCAENFDNPAQNRSRHILHRRKDVHNENNFILRKLTQKSDNLHVK